MVFSLPSPLLYLSSLSSLSSLSPLLFPLSSCTFSLLQLDLGQAVGADGEILSRGGGNGAYSGISRALGLGTTTGAAGSGSSGNGQNSSTQGGGAGAGGGGVGVGGGVVPSSVAGKHMSSYILVDLTVSNCNNNPNALLR